MATQSPFSFLDDFFQKAQLPEPPAWALEEMQRRVVLLVNHVVMQEPVAMQRLSRLKGQVILTQWRQFNLRISITPAGLFDLAPVDAPADLTLVLTETSPLALAQALMQGDKPAVRIEGDVQLAAEVNWLADHVRWDLEEDLSRILGDAPAHMLAQAVRSGAQALRQFMGSVAGRAATAAEPSDRKA